MNKILVVCPFCNAPNEILQLDCEKQIVVGKCHSCKTGLTIHITVEAEAMNNG